MHSGILDTLLGQGQLPCHTVIKRVLHGHLEVQALRYSDTRFMIIDASAAALGSSSCPSCIVASPGGLSNGAVCELLDWVYARIKWMAVHPPE